MMEMYAVFTRTVSHDCGIDWVYPGIMTSNHNEACNMFNKEKEHLLNSMIDYNKSIETNNENTFCIKYTRGDIAVYKYVKLIDLY